MREKMKLACAGILIVGLVVLSGCRSKSNTARSGGAGKTEQTRKAFLDQKKQIPAGLEWSREITSTGGGRVIFRVTSQGPFAVSVITGKGYQVLQSGKTPSKADLLFTVDAPGPTLEQSVTVNAGSSWFIIENQTKQTVEFRLECFEP